MKAFLRNPIKKKQYLLLLGDVIVVLAAFIVNCSFRGVMYGHEGIDMLWQNLSLLVFIAVMVHIVSFYIFELYNVHNGRPRGRMLLMTIIAVLISVGSISIFTYQFPQAIVRGSLTGIYVALVISGTFLWRIFFFGKVLKNSCKIRLAFFDIDPQGREMADLLARHPTMDYHMQAVVPDYDAATGLLMPPSHAGPIDIGSFLSQGGITSVVLAEDFPKSAAFNKQLLGIKFKGIEIYDFPTFYGMLAGKIPVAHTSEAWFLFTKQDKTFRPAMYSKVKRFFDLLIASVGLVLSTPIIAAIALAIKLTSKGPVFFRQERLGLDEAPFTLVKFRTMIDDAEKMTGPKWSSKADPRITVVGKFLRKTRLDELPQLWNILKGEMSLVGPRPIRKHFADKLAEKIPFYRLRFVVKPGATGWAQVNAGYAGSEEDQLEKLEYELFYIQNRSLLLDMYTFLKTVRTVLSRRGE